MSGRRLLRGHVPEHENEALIDEMIAAYVHWAEREATADEAYRGWASAPASCAAQRFRSYTIALDREEAAAGFYARAVRDVRHSRER